MKEITPSPDSKVIKLLTFDTLFLPLRLPRFPAKMTLVHARALLTFVVLRKVVFVVESNVEWLSSNIVVIYVDSTLWSADSLPVEPPDAVFLIPRAKIFRFWIPQAKISVL